LRWDSLEKAIVNSKGDLDLFWQLNTNEKLIEYKEHIQRNFKLVKLKTDLTLIEEISQFNPDYLNQLIEKYECKSLKGKVSELA
jgi:hypothetical protein